ncbi:BTB/POZ domain-containing protein FBL11 isoform X2 [Andrographis paniculata]|uniref:BTB/POZ domain-containing protein FBL11 isoform X2 n=1 Tax=Andrographis paniculata TaxID=175694 RepID=UPI0021E805CE|nr:BTB/POZ domain-containing protein FBL11 isoform X2 [Andrographis paniculata]
MASIPHNRDSDHLVTLVICSQSYSNASGLNQEPRDSNVIAVSTAEIGTWDLPSLISRSALKVEVDPQRLVEQSSYFRGLLGGSFSEARNSSVSIQWEVESFVTVLRVIFGLEIEITVDSYIPLNEAALFFGVDSLLLKCQDWLVKVTSSQGEHQELGFGNDLVCIWKYGVDSSTEFILKLCTGYLAKNFMWALRSNSFKDVPEKLLCACIEHPDLTVESEKQLCDAILSWITTNTAKPEGVSRHYLCDKIRTSLLPLWFAAGMLSCKVDISGCPQMTPLVFLISLLSSLPEPKLKTKIINRHFSSYESSVLDQCMISKALHLGLTFEAVEELDISNCPSLSLESVIYILRKSFPLLRTLRAAFSLNFMTKMLCQMLEKFPLLNIVDLTLDISPVIPGKVSVLSSSSVPRQQQRSIPSSDSTSIFLFTIPLRWVSMPVESNVTKLILAGRTDIRDSELLRIADSCASLSYIDIRGCTSVTDNAISTMILKCKMLHSVLACHTSFGNSSIEVLSGIPSETQRSLSPRNQLQTLHVGGCHGVNGKNLSVLMPGVCQLISFCVRDIRYVDDALYMFSGTSLEVLDISDTEVSGAALSHIICRNPHLKSLKARGCRHLLPQEVDAHETKTCMLSDTIEEWYSVLGRSCKLEEIELGWGITYFSLRALEPALRTLRTLVVGVGGSLGEDGLKLLPSCCQMLETLVLYFQVISDSTLTSILSSLPHLRNLALCYCLGDISSLSFKLRMPTLRILKLERVAPWMTNEELATLAGNCLNLVELSLIGCTLLDSEAQAIISSGWPGLTCLRLEECGQTTTGGVSFLLECHALEDLTLRHSGHGISRNFIVQSASMLPMLRRISLDECDAEHGDYEIPSFSNRYFLSVVKIARCEHRKRSFDLLGSWLHEETLVVAWNSERVDRTVVKERL